VRYADHDTTIHGTTTFWRTRLETRLTPPQTTAIRSQDGGACCFSLSPSWRKRQTHGENTSTHTSAVVGILLNPPSEHAGLGETPTDFAEGMKTGKPTSRDWLLDPPVLEVLPDLPVSRGRRSEAHGALQLEVLQEAGDGSQVHLCLEPGLRPESTQKTPVCVCEREREREVGVEGEIGKTTQITTTIGTEKCTHTPKKGTHTHTHPIEKRNVFSMPPTTGVCSLFSWLARQMPAKEHIQTHERGIASRTIFARAYKFHARKRDTLVSPASSLVLERSIGLGAKHSEHGRAGRRGTNERDQHSSRFNDQFGRPHHLAGLKNTTPTCHPTANPRNPSPCARRAACVMCK